MKDFKDKVAVVTGAASGIGRGMAETFVAAGMKVVLSDIDNSRSKRLLADFLRRPPMCTQC
jgi:NAD(P)-dependent dehydrogenase (short-subunit alcohol dehydrogenase family)